MLTKRQVDIMFNPMGDHLNGTWYARAKVNGAWIEGPEFTTPQEAEASAVEMHALVVALWWPPPPEHTPCGYNRKPNPSTRPRYEAHWLSPGGMSYDALCAHVDASYPPGTMVSFLPAHVQVGAVTQCQPKKVPQS